VRLLLSRLVGLAALFTTALMGSPALALEIVVSEATVYTSPTLTSGQLVVYVRLAPGEPPPSIAGYQVAANLAPTASVAFVTPFASSTSAPHVPLISQNFDANFGSDNGPLRASASAFLDTGATPASSGLGLMSIRFQVQPNTLGDFVVSLDTNAISGTVLSNGVGNSVPYTPIQGRIRVVQAPAVPVFPGETQVLFGLLIALTAEAGLVRRKKRNWISRRMDQTGSTNGSTADGRQ
jgi:hypothetical protein